MTSNDDAPTGVLYTKHRPLRFGDLVGQDATAAMLSNAVASDNSPHAWLFAGPRGCGKTSAARVLAAALSCENRRPGDGEPCNVCDACVATRKGRNTDVLELDAASNSGVDAIRDLCRKAQLAAAGKRRVIILDEAHQLTTQASNALLKTLEEPPPHVTFVLATTDPRKVLPTVRSRCTDAKFRLVPADVMREHLLRIVASDGLEVDAAAIEAAITAGGGSVRDTLSALQGLIAGGDTTVTDAQGVVDAVEARDLAAVIAQIDASIADGADARELLESTAVLCRTRFLDAMHGNRAADLPPLVAALEGCGEAMARITAGWDPRVSFELSLVGRLNQFTK